MLLVIGKKSRPAGFLQYTNTVTLSLSSPLDYMDIKSKRTEFFNGARDTLPLVIGAIPFGIIAEGIGTGNSLMISGVLLAILTLAFVRWNPKFLKIA